jgi:hypothetical protein
MMHRLTTPLTCAACRDPIIHAEDVIVGDHGAAHLKCRSRHLRDVSRELFAFGQAARNRGQAVLMRSARQRGTGTSL